MTSHSTQASAKAAKAAKAVSADGASFAAMIPTTHIAVGITHPKVRDVGVTAAK